MEGLLACRELPAALLSPHPPAPPQPPEDRQTDGVLLCQ